MDLMGGINGDHWEFAECGGFNGHSGHRCMRAQPFCARRPLRRYLTAESGGARFEHDPVFILKTVDRAGARIQLNLPAESNLEQCGIFWGITHITAPHRVLDSVLYALMEYSKLTLPVLLYVLLEALHHKGGAFVITSPEWGIATAFLAIHGPGLCEEEVARVGRGVSVLRMRFFRSLGLLLAVVALLNSFVSFDQETALKVLLRLALFCFASIAFVLVVGAARHRGLCMARQVS